MYMYVYVYMYMYVYVYMYMYMYIHMYANWIFHDVHVQRFVHKFPPTGCSQCTGTISTSLRHQRWHASGGDPRNLQETGSTKHWSIVFFAGEDFQETKVLTLTYSGVLLQMFSENDSANCYLNAIAPRCHWRLGTLHCIYVEFTWHTSLRKLSLSSFKQFPFAGTWCLTVPFRSNPRCSACSLCIQRFGATEVSRPS